MTDQGGGLINYFVFGVFFFIFFYFFSPRNHEVWCITDARIPRKSIWVSRLHSCSPSLQLRPDANFTLGMFPSIRYSSITGLPITTYLNSMEFSFLLFFYVLISIHVFLFVLILPFRIVDDGCRLSSSSSSRGLCVRRSYQKFIGYVDQFVLNDGAHHDLL